MTDPVKRIVLKTWIGLAGVVVSIVVALAISLLWGPLWGVYGLRVIASALMIFSFFALLAIEEFLRAPNPYSRVHPLFGLQDLGPAADLDGANSSLLLAGSPLLIGAGVLILTLWLL